MTTKPIQSVIPPNGGARVINYDPGVPVYTLTIVNQHSKSIAIGVSYDRSTGALYINATETGV